MNLYDVQTGFYNAITVLFENSSAGFLEGTKIEIIPFMIPGESQLAKFKVIMAFRIIGVIWMAVLTVNTLLKRKSFI